MYVPPIYIKDVGGHVTVTLVQGENNKVDVGIDQFSESLFEECGLHLLHKSHFLQHSDTLENFNEWLNGFPFLKESIYYQREYRREKVISEIKQILEEKRNLLILGKSGTSKSTLIMEVLTDYLKKDVKVLYNLDPGDGKIENIKHVENKIEGLVNGGNDILVVVDDVHNQTKSLIFPLIKNLQTLDIQKRKKIRFLLAARQPEFDLAMDKGLFDTNIIQTIKSIFDNTRKYNIPYFTEDEIVGFIEKYKENVHISKRSKSITDFAHEIFEDTKGHPIMVRFSVIQDGLRTHVEKMYSDYLVQKDGEDNFPNTERIKSVIACSLYHISSIPLTEDELFNKLDLKKPSLQIINTMIKRTGKVWTTIHPRWDLELFKYMFSLNESDREEIQQVFSYVLTKILEVQRCDQLLILNIVYNTIAAEQFIDIKIIQEMIKVEDIEKKIDNPYFKILFFFNILCSAFNKLKDYENAIVYYDKAIEINPKYGDAYNHKGYALSALGRKEEAIACCEKVIEIDPEYTYAYFNKGIALSDLGRKEEAIASYDKAIEIDPQFANAYYNKGITLYDIGRKEEAIACYDKAIEIDPQFAMAYNNKGNPLLALGRKEEAIACYDKAIEIDPQFAMAYNNKGHVLSAIGRKEEAIACYDKAIEIDPKDADAYNHKGYALSYLGRKEEAIACYDKAIEIDPKDANAYNNKGLILYDLGRSEEAITRYDKAIEITPKYADAYLNKGNALLALGRKEEAIACYDNAIEIDPQFAMAYNNKGIALSDLDRMEEAIASYDKALAIDPNYSYALNGKAFALAELDKNEEALPIIEKALEIAPNTDYVLATAAFIMYNLKRHDEAKLYYNKALDINPNLKDTFSESELKAFNSVME
jgi:tetratricopeptide (TPR) repeat protein